MKPKSTPASDSDEYQPLLELSRISQKNLEGGSEILATTIWRLGKVQEHAKALLESGELLSAAWLRTKVHQPIEEALRSLHAAALQAEAANQAGDRLQNFLLALQLPPGTLNNVWGGQMEIRSLVLRRIQRTRGGKSEIFEFFLDRHPVRLREKPGRLLKMLMADDGTSTDECVAFKSQEMIEEELGLKPTTLTSQVHRLRQFFTTQLQLPAELIEHQVGAGYRVRLLRDSGAGLAAA